MITEDIQADERWRNGWAVAEEAGLRSCWSMPIRDEEGEVLGTFALYGPQPRTPTTAEKELIHEMVYVASVALNRENRERALRKSEERWRRLVDEHPGPIHVSVDGKYVYANQATADLLGVESVDDLIGRDMSDFIPPEEREQNRARGQQLYGERKEVELIESQIERPNGERRTILVRSVPITYEGQVAAQTMMWDITDRKEQERELREVNQRLRLALDAAGAGTFDYDVETDEVVWDEQTLEIYGLEGESPRQVHSSILDDYLPDDEQDHLEEVFYGAIEEEERYQVTYRIHRPDGEERYVHSRGRVLRDEAGEAQRVIGINQDVTERKVRERILRNERDRFSTLFESLPTPVVHGTFQGDTLTVSTVNSSFESVFGYQTEEAIGQDLYDLIVPEGEREAAASYDRQALEEGMMRTEVRRQTADGLRDFKLQIAARKPEEGPPETYAIYTDITERKEREERLRLLEAAVEHSLVTVLITEAGPLDEPGPKTVYANPAFTRITGYETDEIIGRSPRILQGPDTDRAALDRIRAALERNEPVRETVLNYGKDGTPYWTDLFIAPVWDDDGNVTHFVSIQNDVTERRRRTRKLERINDLFAKAQDLASVGAWEYDVASGEPTFTTEVYRIHGLSPDAELGPERSIEYYHPDDRSTIRDAFRRAVEEGESYELELRLIPEDGEQKWVRTRGEPQWEDGEIVRVRGTIQDVTQQVQQREALKEAKEAAEEADRIKTALLSNMNHEFRTPLTSIITFSELIRDNPDVAERFVDRIHGGGKRLLYTLNTVMDFAELEGGGLSVTPQPIQPREVVESVVNDFRDKARRKGIELSVDRSGDVRRASLDRHVVERILTHLVHNAVKFTEEGSATVGVRTLEDAVEFWVEDTGVGIDPAFLPQVFDEFAQQSSGYDRTHEGNGLGLTIVKRLVEALEGDIDLQSEPGEGTTVTVRLPLGS